MTIQGYNRIATVLAVLTAPLSSNAAELWQYASKFICGPIASDIDVVKGSYLTTVNIHNASGTTIELQKTAVIALPERTLPRGRISLPVVDALKAEEAMGVDCTDIRRLLTVTGVVLPAHIEGFLIVKTPVNTNTPATISDPLDVVTKFTARHRNSAVVGADPTVSDVETLDVQRIPVKRILVP